MSQQYCLSSTSKLSSDKDRPKLSIGIVGGGVSGLGAAAFAHRFGHQVTVFEKDKSIGGHAHIAFLSGNEVSVGAVSMMGSYVNVLGWMKELGLEMHSFEGSSTFHFDKTQVSTSLWNLLRNPLVALHPRTIWFGLNYFSFKACGEEYVAQRKAGSTAEITCKEFLQRYLFWGDTTVMDDFVRSLARILFAVPVEEIFDYPASYVLEEMSHRGIDAPLHCIGLKVFHPTIGNSGYMTKIRDLFGDRIRTGDAGCVTLIERNEQAGSVTLHVKSGEKLTFDRVILATTHGAEVLKLLGEGASPMERQVLSKFGFTTNKVVLHTDASLMPTNKSMWSVYNYHAPGANQPYSLCMWLNPTQPDLTISPLFESSLTQGMKTPDESTVLHTWGVQHPRMSTAAYNSIQNGEIGLLNEQGRGVFLAGAWTSGGLGSHDAAYVSGCRAAATAVNEHYSPINVRLHSIHSLLSKIVAGPRLMLLRILGRTTPHFN